MATDEYIVSIKNDVLPTLTSLSAADKLVIISYLNEARQVHSREVHRLLERQRSSTRSIANFLGNRIRNLKVSPDLPS